MLKNCYDAVGVMLLILITQQSKRFMELKRAPCLDAYFERTVCTICIILLSFLYRSLSVFLFRRSVWLCLEVKNPFLISPVVMLRMYIADADYLYPLSSLASCGRTSSA